MLDFAAARRTMVDRQVRTFDVTNLAIIAAFDEAPREKFVPPGREALAYSDVAVPLDSTAPFARRCLLAPMIVARMLQALDLSEGEAVLDAGCATGYTTLLLHRLGARVTGLEPDEALAAAAREALAESGAGGVEIAVGPIAAGYAKGAPYDAILLNSAFEVQPQALLDQLVDGGRLVGIDATEAVATASLYVKRGTALSRQPLFGASAPIVDGLEAPAKFVF
ncbi:protein-L-isoaspartate O-methyltransferase family protein [Chelatococcus reniformis]|nr:protein-L-isoaspartate O-methyltransferase [Chelatococcus reniformis]